MKIYISGPITGVCNYKKRFVTAENDLHELGHVALNPAMLPFGLTEAEYMRVLYGEDCHADH